MINTTLNLSKLMDGGEFVYTEIISGCLLAIAQDRRGQFYSVTPVSFSAWMDCGKSLHQLTATTLKDAITEAKREVAAELRFRLDGVDEYQDVDVAGISFPSEVMGLQLAIADLTR